MRQPQRRPAPKRRGRRLVAAAVGLVVLAGVALGLLRLARSTDPLAAPSAQRVRSVTVNAGGRTVARLRPADLRRLRRSGLERAARSLALALPQQASVRRGGARIAVRYDPLATAAAVLARGTAGGAVRAVTRPVASYFRLPIVRQRLRNNCETAALSMLLAARSRSVGQLALQRRLPKSAPLDPVVKNGETIWGDPDRGFVGRPDGGGPSGGYGVYEGPIRRLAMRHGVALADLTGRPARALYERLLAGRPVMVWVGLSAGPYRTWSTAGGRRVQGNLGEHTVVLTGVDGGSVAVNDPLDGARKRWSKQEFEAMWQRLGRRALGA